MADLVKSVTLKIKADDGDAEAKLKAIDAQAEALAAKHPELKVKIDQAAASAKLKVLRGELMATSTAATNAGKSVSSALNGVSSNAKAQGAQAGGFWHNSFTTTILGGLAGTLITGVGAALSVLPALGAIGGVGLAGAVAVGIASKTPAVANQIKQLGTTAMSTLTDAVKPILPVIQGLITQVSGFVQSEGPELAQVFAAVGPALLPMVQGVERLVANLLPGLVTLLQAAMPAVTAFRGILGSLGSAVGSLFSGLAPAVQASAQALTALFDIITPLLPDIAQLAAMAAKSLAPAMSMLASVFQGLSPVVQVVGQVFTGFAKAFMVNLAGGLQAVMGLVKAVEPALMTLAKAFSQVFTLLENRGVFNDIEDAIEGLVGPLAKLITALVNGLVPVIPPLVTILGDLAGLLQTVLVSAVQSLVPVLIPVIGLLSKLLMDIIPPLVPFVKQLATQLGTQFASELKQAMPSLGQLAQALVKILIALTPLIPPVTKLILLFVQWGADASSGLLPVTIKLIGLLTGLVTVIGIVVGWTVKIVAGIVNWLTSMDRLKTGISNATAGIRQDWNSMVSGLTSAFNAVVGFFEGIPGRIVHAVGDLGNLLFDAGKNVIQGLLNGVESMIGPVANVMSGITGKIRNFLPFSPAKEGPLSGSGSPELAGRKIPAMLAQGMAAGTAAVSAAAGRMAGAAVIGAGGGAAGGGSQVVAMTGPADFMAIVKMLWPDLRLEVRNKGGGGPFSAQRAFGEVVPT